MTFLTNQQQKLLQEYHEMVHERLIEAIAQFHFQTQQAELRKIVEQALIKQSPPYQITCMTEEEMHRCDSMNK